MDAVNPPPSVRLDLAVLEIYICVTEFKTCHSGQHSSPCEARFLRNLEGSLQPGLYLGFLKPMLMSSS